MERIKLICIPHAGAGVNYYSLLKKRLLPEIEICPIELPGRGRRARESLIEEFDLAIEDLFKQAASICHKERRYAIFGHSLGSVCAYELAHMLAERGYGSASYLFLSGQAPVDHFVMEKKHEKVNDEFREDIVQLGGVAEEIMAHGELAEMMMHIVLADFKIMHSYRYQSRPVKLGCDIITFNGEEDPYVSPNIIGMWGYHTTGVHHQYMYEGGHFFINRWIRDIASKINKAIMGVNYENGAGQG